MKGRSALFVEMSKDGVQCGAMTNRQSTWYIIVHGVAAFGTLLVVIVTLFGDYLKPKPALDLRLLSDTGERVKFTDGTEGRFYFLRVENGRRWTKATSAGLHMLRLERRGPDGGWVTEWAGDVQIQCRDQFLYPLQRDIGSPIDYEVLSVRDATPPELRLYPIFVPTNLTVVTKQKWEFVAWFQAKSSEVDSDVVRLQVLWDGLWESGEEEMQTHLKIKPLHPSSS